MGSDDGGRPGLGRDGLGAAPLLVATILREQGVTETQAHVREFRRFLSEQGTISKLVTPFSWGGALSTPVFAARRALSWCHGDAGVAWYQYWHEEFLHRALRRDLSGLGDAVVYAQGPEAARAALRARRGASQRVVMAVHYRSSQADGFVERGSLGLGSSVYQAIKRREYEVIPQVDAIVYVSELARDSLLSWLPEAKEVPAVVVPTLAEGVTPPPNGLPTSDLVTVGSLAPTKHHRFLLEVLAKAKDLGRPLALDIFGEGPSRQSLEVTARALGVGDQVRFLGYPSDLPQRLMGYRAYVHSCSLEATSLAIVEAMAAGLPIFATGEGVHCELYDDGVEGRFWSTEGAEAAATMLVGVLDDEATRSRYAAAARQRFLARFDARVVGPRLAAFLRAN
jgi:glycosyltransferase involved in cell wall biosynthesis